MESINKVELCGFVGSVITAKTDDNNWARFTLATNHSYTKDGNTIVETTWHTVTAFQNNMTQNLAEIEKGCAVRLQGRIRTNRYVASDGKERISNEILALSLTVIKDKPASLPASKED